MRDSKHGSFLQRDVPRQRKYWRATPYLPLPLPPPLPLLPFLPLPRPLPLLPLHPLAAGRSPCTEQVALCQKPTLRNCLKARYPHHVIYSSSAPVSYSVGRNLKTQAAHTHTHLRFLQMWTRDINLDVLQISIWAYVQYSSF